MLGSGNSPRLNIQNFATKADCRTASKAVEQIYLSKSRAFALERRSRQKEKLTNQITAIKNRLSSIFHWVMPGLLDCFNDTFSPRAREFYRHFSNPFRAQKAGIDGIGQILESAARQKMNQDLPEKLYAVVSQACQLYTASGEYIDFDEIQDEVTIDLEQLEVLEEALRKVADRILTLYNQLHPSKNIETIKGIGENIGPSIIAALGNIERFSAQSKVRSFAGLIPKQDDSGETNKKGLPLTQEGPARLRRDLFLAADVARQWDPQLAKVYYQEMVNKGHCHSQAVCAVITRLINRIVSILKENRPYELKDPEGNPISAKKAKTLIKEQFTVPEEIRKRSRSQRSRRNKKEEGIRNLFRGSFSTPQNSYNIPPINLIQNFEKFCKNTKSITLRQDRRV
jgi:hypothetical protein